MPKRPSFSIKIGDGGSIRKLKIENFFTLEEYMNGSVKIINKAMITD
jgi:hypothetical protein